MHLETAMFLISTLLPYKLLLIFPYIPPVLLHTSYLSPHHLPAVSSSTPHYPAPHYFLLILFTCYLNPAIVYYSCQHTIFIRPGVAGALLQNLCHSFIHSVSHSSFVEISSEHLHSQTVRARELKLREKVYLPPPVMCHMSCVTSHVSHVMCHMSCVTCHTSCVRCHM